MMGGRMAPSSWRRAPIFVAIFGALLLSAPAWAGGGTTGTTVIRNIAISMVAASLAGWLMKLLRQPLLLGYLLGGVLVGPVGLGWVADRHEIETIAEIGLILLLFMIGLEIDLKKMLDAGRLVVVTGIVQFPLTVGIGLLAFWGLTALGLSFGEGPYAVWYLAAAVGLSSTMIVVKLLYDKLELDTLAGRLTLGILVFQDIWAIIVLAIQPNLADPQLGGLLRTFGAGALLVGAALVASRYALPRIFHTVAKVPELLLVLSLGWCFAVGLVAQHPAVGLSMEMGALIAGISLATFPYNLEVNAKVLNIRDFFITLFFVALGMQIPVPSWSVLLSAGVIVAVLLFARGLGVFGLLHALRGGHFVSILPTINLSQLSEFSLVILTIGVAHGHIGQQTLTLGIWTFALLAVASTYAITASHRLEGVLSRALTRLGVRDLPAALAEPKGPAERSVVLLGFFRIARAFVDDASRRDQRLLEQVKVIDFNPDSRPALEALGVPCIYGDVANPDTLHHAKVADARVIISTVPDGALRGTSNARLLKVLRELCPSATVIVTAETPEQAQALYEQGADFVLQPSALSGGALVTVVEQACRSNCDGMREQARSALASHAAGPAQSAPPLRSAS
jgi:Kef-type K+ transport system membrane component KefB